MIKEVGSLFVKSLERQPLRQDIGVSIRCMCRHNYSHFTCFISNLSSKSFGMKEGPNRNLTRRGPSVTID